MEFGEKESAHLAISLWQSPEPFLALGRGAVAIFKVPDAYTAVAEMRKRGVKCDDVMGIPGMVTFASFYDPVGNELQVAGPPPKM